MAIGRAGRRLEIGVPQPLFLRGRDLRGTAKLTEVFIMFLKIDVFAAQPIRPGASILRHHLPRY
jgi:hypothetical protein